MILAVVAIQLVFGVEMRAALTAVELMRVCHVRVLM